MTSPTYHPALTALYERLRREGRCAISNPTSITMTRAQLAQFFAECGFLFGAEVGVWKGEFAETLLLANPKMRLMCIDPWAPQDDYLEQKNDAEILDRAFREAIKRLSRFDAPMTRMRSTDAAKKFPDGSLDFVYIDGNHRYEAVLEDLVAWVPKVRAGGIVSGHDFLNKAKRHIGVEQAVREFTAAWGIDPWFVLVGDDTKDIHPSWAWVKQ